ncbi:MAG: hypothetical protein JNJ57_04745, partial [Saprospiraceae bacterium]|nr:hypothetical protein [Saprospiraceae bacterium]
MQLLHKQTKLVAVAALFPAALLLYVWLCKIDLSLTHLDAIVFSQATSDGVDVGKRVGLFFKGIFGGTLLFLAVIAVFVKLLNLQ